MTDDKLVIALLNAALQLIQDIDFSETYQTMQDQFLDLVQPLRDAVEAFGIDPDNTGRIGR